MDKKGKQPTRILLEKLILSHFPLSLHIDLHGKEKHKPKSMYNPSGGGERITHFKSMLPMKGRGDHKGYENLVKQKQK